MRYIVKKNDELYHFGILGMKWGVRRFQNPDGTLTEAGKKRYAGDSLGSAPTKDISAIKKRSASFERIDKDYWVPKYEKARIKGSEDHQNAMAAANLGLKALRQHGLTNFKKDDEPFDGNDREWFLFEDQTIGMPEVAHLINRGYSSKEVKSYIKEVNDNWDSERDYYRYFGLREGYGLGEFAEWCEKVKSS